MKDQVSETQNFIRDFYIKKRIMSNIDKVIKIQKYYRGRKQRMRLQLIIRVLANSVRIKNLIERKIDHFKLKNAFDQIYSYAEFKFLDGRL